MSRNTTQADRRREPRLEIKLRVIISNSDVSFRTHTINISNGGFLLEEGVPAEILNGICEVFIASQEFNENMRMKVTLVSDSTQANRFKFLPQDDAALARLKVWISSLAAMNSVRTRMKSSA